MSKYIETAGDLNIRGVEFFVKESPDGYAYVDEACEVKADKATLLHAFEMNNAVIVDGDNKYRPISILADPDEEYCALTYITAVTAGTPAVTTATITVVYSEEYTAE